MIKEKDLESITSWQYNSDPEFTLDVVLKAIKSSINDYQFNAEAVIDTVSGGSLLRPTEYRCVKVYNPAHTTDYYYYCLVLSKERFNDTIYVSGGGYSSQMKKDDYLKNTKAFDGTISSSIGIGAITRGSFGAGYAIGGAVAGITKAGVHGIGKGIAALTRDKEALAIEEQWYADMQEILLRTFA